MRRVGGEDPRRGTTQNIGRPGAELKTVATSAPGATGSLLPAPKNYILITACRERETAKEYGSNGVFTFFMLEHLTNGLTGLTFRDLQDRITGSIRTLASDDRSYDEQTPQLEGNGNLVVFGGGVVAEPRALSAILQADGTILLPGAGAAVGVVVGTTVGLYSPGTIDFADPGGQIGVATVKQVRADAAVCKVGHDVPAEKLVPGMRAIVIRPGVAKIRRRVALIGGAELDELRGLIATPGPDGLTSPVLELVEEDERPELSVVVSDGIYSIRDNLDQPLPRISPPVTVAGRRTAAKVLKRLEHIVQYRNAWELYNGDESSKLRDALAISIKRGVTRSGGRVGLNPGDQITICVHNRSAQLRERRLAASLRTGRWPAISGRTAASAYTRMWGGQRRDSPEGAGHGGQPARGGDIERRSAQTVRDTEKPANQLRYPVSGQARSGTRHEARGAGRPPQG